MRRPRLRALVLTAGLGTRLRPLTATVPKPLLPLAGLPVVAHTLAQLERAGCEVAVLNLHHGGEAIRAALGSRYGRLALRYSEEPEILGTGGALRPPRGLLQEADAVLVLNGDTACPWPLAALLRRHRRSGADLTVLLLRRSPDPALGGGIGLGGGGWVVQLRDGAPVGKVKSRHVFAGAQLIVPALLDRLPEGASDVVGELWAPVLSGGGTLAAVLHRGPWHDLGTPARYLEAALDARPRGRIRRPAAWVSPLARVAPDAVLATAVVEDDAEIGDGVRLESAVVLPGARVGARSRVRRSIVGPGVVLPPATDVEGRMIVREPRGYRAAPGESVLAGLVYTPLDGTSEPARGPARVH